MDADAVTFLVGLVVFVAVCAAAYWAGHRQASRGRAASALMRRTVIVERFGASSVRGLLVAEYEDGIALRHAVSLEEQSRGAPIEVPLDGDFVVYRGIVAGMQDMSATLAYAQSRPVAVPSARPSPIAARFAEAPQDPRPMAGG